MRVFEASGARGFSRAAVLFLIPARLFAHPLDPAVITESNWRRWTLEPGVILGLAALGCAYVFAARRRRHAPGHARLSPLTIGAFAAGWTVTAVALVSPIDALGSVLFSAHMVQHELLMIVAAPLLVLGTPAGLIHAAAGPLARRARAIYGVAARGAAWATSPVVAWLLHATAIVAWHVPFLFDLAVHNDAVHAAQHLSFFGTALLFWWGVLRRAPASRAYGLSLVGIFTTATYTAVFGALLTVAPTALYAAYSSSTSSWGLTALEDQQLGGLIMWVPAGVVYTIIGLWMFARWLRSSEPRKVAWTQPVVLAIVVGTMSTLACTNAETYKAAAAMTGGDPNRGSEALTSYGCDTCHTIPGIRSARGLVGPPLTSVGSRVYLAGRVPNTPANITRWIQHPHAIDDKTAMPETGVTDQDARDIAAYLYTLR
jgi:putative membrane protein